jgi:hypothetical protein
MHELWYVLATGGFTLAGGALGGWFFRRASRDERLEQRHRDLDAAFSEYLAAVIKAVAGITRVPIVDPDFWFHRLSDAIEKGKTRLLGPTVGFAQRERGLRSTFADQPFLLAERVVDAHARLLVLDPGPEVAAVTDKISDHLIALGSDRSQTRLDQWPELRRELLEAIQVARGRELLPVERPAPERDALPEPRALELEAGPNASGDDQAV